MSSISFMSQQFMNQCQPKNTICKHLKFINKQTIKKAVSEQISKQCSTHSFPISHLCLHCGYAVCLQFQQELSCLQLHQKLNPNHIFAFQMNQGSIWCSQCKDTIQNLIFTYDGDSKNEDFQRMKKFAAYLTSVWKQLTQKNQFKVSLISHRGIKNLGNTCFLNSVLQSLFASVQLNSLYQQIEAVKSGLLQQNICLNKKLIRKEIQYFYDDVLQKMENDKWTVVKTKKERSLLSETKNFQVTSIKTAKFNVIFKQFLRQMLQEKENPFVPNKILTFLSQISTKYKLQEEQDADELLLLIIDILSEGQRISLLKDIDRYKSVERVLGNQKLTPTQTIFGFYLLNEVQCHQCKEISTSLNLTYNISLSIDPVISKEQYQIIHKSDTIKMDYWQQLKYPQQSEKQSFLQPFFKVQRLNKHSNYYECSKCKSIVAYRQYYMISPPEILIITIKRFNSQLQKKEKYIAFPQQLDLKGITAGVESNKYNLYSVIVHEGRSLSSGHYLCFIKIDKQWLLCSDDRVQAVSWNQVKSQQAYILLYSKCYDL